MCFHKQTNSQHFQLLPASYKRKMELQLENVSVTCIESLINNVTLFLCGNTCTNNSIVKVNNENLAMNGELYFLPSLKVWQRILNGTDQCVSNCATIFHYFFHRNNTKINNSSDTEVANEVLQSLISHSNCWEIKIEKYLLKKERICLFLQRAPLVEHYIKAAVTLNDHFGRTLLLNKVFCLKFVEDNESELTTARLRIIKGVAEKVLALYGCKVLEKEYDYKYVFTSKSQGTVEENYRKFVCGVVKNTETKGKETNLTWQQYIQNRRKELKELNEHKYFEVHECNLKPKEYFVDNLAQAAATFEFLSVKPSRPVFIGCNFATDKNTTNTKGATFVLYNTARITTIIEKYKDKSLKGDYPSLPSVNDIDFSLLNQEEEWELVYNFIIGYQDMIKDCLKYEPVLQINPQVICIFLSRLCQKFSIYYRRTRILTEAYEHLIPTMTARLYMLHALKIVLQNALALLNIVPVSRM